MYLERNTYTTPHVLSLSFIMVISKFISVDEMKELVIMKDLSYSDVSNILEENNQHAKGISEKSFRLFCTSNNIRKWSNLGKEKFHRKIFLKASQVWHLMYLQFMEIIAFQKGFEEHHPSYSAFWITLLSLWKYPLFRRLLRSLK